VVADEVRKLAERTGSATAQITLVIASVQAETDSAVASIEQIGPQVANGSELSGKAAEALRAINRGAQGTLARLEDVVCSTRELSAASNSAASNMQHIAEMAERNGVEVQRSADSTANLKRSSEALVASVAHFRVA
jgi:methyl-accepting chemotaxis protein